MSENDQRHLRAFHENMAAETAVHLADLHQFDLVFTTWKRGETIRGGIVVGHSPEDRMVKLLEVYPDIEPCPTCQAVPRDMRTAMLTVPYKDISEIRRMEWASRTGWGMKLLHTVIFGRDLSSDRARQLIGWAVNLGRVDGP